MLLNNITFWIPHKKEKSPLTQGLNYRSACDTATYWLKIANFSYPLHFDVISNKMDTVVFNSLHVTHYSTKFLNAQDNNVVLE